MHGGTFQHYSKMGGAVLLVFFVPSEIKIKRGHRCPRKGGWHTLAAPGSWGEAWEGARRPQDCASVSIHSPSIFLFQFSFSLKKDNERVCRFSKLRGPSLEVPKKLTMRSCQRKAHWRGMQGHPPKAYSLENSWQLAGVEMDLFFK